MAEDDPRPSLTEAVGKLVTGGLLGGDLPGNLARGMYSTTRRAVEDGVGELLGPIAVWLTVGVTFLVGLQLLVVGAIVAGVPAIGVVLLAAGAFTILASAVATGWLVYAAGSERAD